MQLFKAARRRQLVTPLLITGDFKILMDSPIAVHTLRHNHRRCISSALAAAQRLCGHGGLRLTALRSRVLEHIWAGHDAVKAYDILKKLASENASAQPPTVYRALNFLLEQGLVHRLESVNAFVGCTAPEQAHEGQFLICGSCSVVREIQVPAASRALAASALESGFLVARQTIEVLGTCSDCGGKP